jgi:hypothetical protein
VNARIFSAGQAHVSDHANQPTSGHQCVVAAAPNFVERFEKRFVVLDVTKLAVSPFVFLQRPVGWRCHDEVDGVGLKEVQVPRIRIAKCVCRGNALNRAFNCRGAFSVLRNGGKGCLMIPQLVEIKGKIGGKIDLVLVEVWRIHRAIIEW